MDLESTMATSGDDVELKLLGMPASPYGNRVQISLNLKGIPYELIEEDLFNKNQLLLASNPVHKKIPVLIHGDKCICESLVIVEYIDEVWITDCRILSFDPFDRAMARFWAAYIDNQWFPLILKLRDETPKEEEAKTELIRKIKEGFAVLEEAFLTCSKGKAFFGGDEIGYLDIALGSFWSWMLAIEMLTVVKLFDEEETPGLCRWIDKLMAHEIVKDVILEPRKLIGVYEKYQARGWEF